MERPRNSDAAGLREILGRYRSSGSSATKQLVAAVHERVKELESVFRHVERADTRPWSDLGDVRSTATSDDALNAVPYHYSGEQW